MATTATDSIGDQVTEFNVGFTEAIGPELATVFANEQTELIRSGVPGGAVTEGRSIPDASLVAPDGSAVQLADLIADQASVLIFYRGAWCPYCNIALKHYNQTLAPALADRGVALVAISPQTPEGSSASVQNGELDFTVVSDPGNALAAELGIVTAPSPEAQQAHIALGFEVKDSNADDTPAIPYPSVLVIDRDGIVKWADVHVDYTTRSETGDILAAVDQLR